jgi:hypothetical protein
MLKRFLKYNETSVHHFWRDQRAQTTNAQKQQQWEEHCMCQIHKKQNKKILHFTLRRTKIPNKQKVMLISVWKYPPPPPPHTHTPKKEVCNSQMFSWKFFLADISEPIPSSKFSVNHTQQCCVHKINDTHYTSKDNDQDNWPDNYLNHHKDLQL